MEAPIVIDIENELATSALRLESGLGATPRQETVLRRAALVAQKSLNEFILDSACLAAEQTLLDQRLFFVSEKGYQDFLDLLEQPAQEQSAIRELFARTPPWAS